MTNLNDRDSEKSSHSSVPDQQGLPLKGQKKLPFKIIGLLLLIVVIVLVNFLFNNASQVDQHPSDAIESYHLNPLESLKNNDNKMSDASHQPNGFNQDQIKLKLEEAKAKDFVERLQASQMVDAGGSRSVTTTGTTEAHASSAQSNAMISNDQNTAYLDHVSEARPERSFAERFGPQPYLIGQGKFIFATLSVAINSDLPGQVSAMVNQNIYGEQGRKILIPRGSRLVGEYRSGLAVNQSRLFIVWTRVIQPNGISVMIGSEGTDALGQAGATGQVDYHFFARFGAATLISLIGAGAANVGVNPNDEYNSMSAYRQAVSQAMSQQASNTLGQSVNIPPTIHVAQGERVVVFVNKDLDFSRVYR